MPDSASTDAEGPQSGKNGLDFATYQMRLAVGSRSSFRRSTESGSSGIFPRNMAEPVFNIVAEYPQVQHVAGDMADTAVHERRTYDAALQIDGSFFLMAGSPASLNFLSRF